MRYVIFDLEWNQPIGRFRITKNDVKLAGEIIQIGAVKVDTNLDTIDKYSRLIKPQAYTKIEQGVTELTEITAEMLEEGAPFTEVVNDFLDWCGSDFVFMSWSPNDIYYLEDNMLFYGLDIDGIPECYDMQLMFDDQITMEDRNFALNYAMWKLNIKPEMCHDALNDALNTLEVMKHLDFSDGIDDYLI